MTLSTKQRVRRYGWFTPAQIAEAMEIARTLPGPSKNELQGMPGDRRGPNTMRYNVELSIPVAFRLWRLAKARGATLNRILTEVFTYYVVAVADATLDGVPELYADFLTPEGLNVLTEAFRAALARLAEDPSAPMAERLQRARFPAEVVHAPEPEPVPEPAAFDSFSLTGEDDLPTLCITIRGETAAAMSRGLEDVRQYVLDHDVAEWDGVKAQDVGYEYECSALDDGTPVRDLHETVTKALVARV